MLVDIVPNHTSNEHAWFRAALAAEPGQSRATRGTCSGRGSVPNGDQPPSDWLSVFGGPAWERVADGEWYLHLFAPEQPDLNWDNPEVRAEFLDILRFWLDRGIDGIRIDVANALTKDLSHPLRDLGLEAQAPACGGGTAARTIRSGTATRCTTSTSTGARCSTPTTATGCRWRRRGCGRRSGARATSAATVCIRRSTSTSSARTSTRSSFRKIIDEEIGTMAMVGADPTWVLSNHDVVREVTRYGDGDAGLQRARAALMLVLALPGSAYVYQGEELGLPEVTDLPDDVLQDPTFFRTGGKVRGRDGCRVPIPWAGSSPPYAFGPDGSTPWLPQPAAWAELSVDAQADDPASMLSMTRYRAAAPSVSCRAAVLVGRRPAGRRARLRRGDGFVCLVNFGDQPASVPDTGLVPLLAQRSRVCRRRVAAAVGGMAGRRGVAPPTSESRAVRNP